MINGKTRIFGIIGNPVSHSLSPVMHNAAFAELGKNCIYLPFTVDDVAAAIKGLRSLNIEGVSVTIPHKEAVIAHLDRIDPVAKKIGAVNTIVRELAPDGELKQLCGYNTDWLGAVKPLQEQMNLQGAEAVILGAGGSARAIGFGLVEAGAGITLCSRTESRGRSLAGELNCPWCALDMVDSLTGDILINATSVGMTPKVEQSPVGVDIPGRYAVVMDIVYAPQMTRLLSDAQKAGCHSIGGLEMLLQQGVAQFELWTSQSAPVEVMRKALRGAVSS